MKDVEQGEHADNEPSGDNDRIVLLEELVEPTDYLIAEVNMHQNAFVSLASF